MLGGGGAPVYCARNIRAEGEPDMLGLSLVKSVTVSLGLLLRISKGFEGEGLLDDGGGMLRGDGGGWRERHECGAIACAHYRSAASALIPGRRLISTLTGKPLSFYVKAYSSS